MLPSGSSRTLLSGRVIFAIFELVRCQGSVVRGPWSVVRGQWSVVRGQLPWVVLRNGVAVAIFAHCKAATRVRTKRSDFTALAIILKIGRRSEAVRLCVPRRKQTIHIHFEALK